MNESKATRYQRLRRRATSTGAAMAGLALALVAFTPLARWLRDQAWHASAGLPAAAAAVAALAFFVTAVWALWELASLPAVIYRIAVVDRAYGRAAGHVEQALAARFQAALLLLPAVFAAGMVVAASVQVAGAGWWIVAGVLLSLALMAIVHGGPRLFSRLAATVPVSRPLLADRLRDLATRVRVPVAGIDEWHGADRSVTALVIGIGRSRRVLVAADLVRQWSDDEIEVVVAHELAHHAHHDLWRTWALDAGILSLALCVADLGVRFIGPLTGAAGPGDLAALPLMAVCASVVWAVARPIRHLQSRRQERRADEAALEWTGQAAAFGSVVRRLGAAHLAEERPSTLTRWLYHRHPPVAERLARAEAHASRSSTRSQALGPGAED